MKDELDDDLGQLGPDPEWDELLAWARESEDEGEWQSLIAQAKQAAVTAEPAVPEPAPVEVTAVIEPEALAAPAPAPAPVPADDADEWGRLLALAKAIPSVPRAAPHRATTPAATPAHAPAGSIASLTARLERLATEVPNARRRAR
jgi:hypothetical protein